MINDDNKSNFKKMLKSNGLYFALGLCLLAAGVVGFTATNNKTPSVMAENTTKQIESITFGEIAEKEEETSFIVEINIDEFTTKAPEEPSTAAVFDNNAEVIEETTEAQKLVFTSPLSFSMGMDYSMGIPVFSQTMNDYRTHNGVDFKGVKGENVKTVAEGTVVSVEKNAVWGNTVTVDHGNGITSAVSGLADEALISVGAQVYTDTVIGIVGDIPVESGEDSHVHLEMRVNGELVDPLEIMGLAGEEE
ncbi:MAG: M23 family metallopeptidase [Clostridia bacterium]|nr:M23 family metallopeptidase [Clostridia bacterium]